MEKLTITQLKLELIRMNLSTTGNKPQLIQRIRSNVRGLSIWNSPLVIIKYFALWVLHVITKTIVTGRTVVVMSLGILTVGLYYIYRLNGLHIQAITNFETTLIWFGYWTGLGIASSIGLGTGLHTFVLFLGPFLAKTTLTAYSCSSLDFDTRGVEAFVCKMGVKGGQVSPLGVFRMVYLEVMFWGAGTAIGELPPYFVAKAAAVAGHNDPGVVTIASIISKPRSKQTLYEKAQVMMHDMVKSLGFWGILILASVPNPLFDLTGVMCGHFGVKFTTFFGATLLGKALVKCNIQAFIVIVFFSPNTLSMIKDLLVEKAPWMNGLLAGMLDSLKRFGDSDQPIEQSEKLGVMGGIWSLFMVGMIGYFVLSTVESLAVAHLREVNKIHADHKIE